ncbi:hypothetical protein [Paracoccus marinaquae]|uniref:Phage gp6-like head-tail connector protein n=1 Tax=Paracoccus marinaquae TaxID=2841926 RepID=A0ABS6AH45_9RHOB|nr:hypothetical protein [Paracoccus marinaquae]MBU3028959.1 hypothetical protein [Paracoccus marinaquae]
MDALVVHMRTGFTAADTEPTILAECQRLADAAAMEIEAYCEISLTTQTITAHTFAEAGELISLPVGPLAPGSTVTVNGTAFTGTVEGGRYPRLTLPEDMSGALTISYEAGYGTDPADVPDDLKLAVMDQASGIFDYRGDDTKRPHLTPAASRIAARYRRVAV